MKLDPAGIPFVVAAVLLTVAVGLLSAPAFAAPLLVLTLFVIWFFRDPHRKPPDDESVLVSPADGKIIVASGTKVSIFMNVFDVHVCRTPAGGTVTNVRHVSGSFVAAYRDDASEHNERATITLDSRWGELRFTLVAGLVARRIVCRVRPGDRLERGQRIGLIRFGSRVDVLLPPGLRPSVRVGGRVVAGETVLARSG
jgi:phosphatidylserine decarboxylase